MATPEQISANQKNSQLSSGPVSEEGKERSAKNSTVHGFTGKTLHLAAEEVEAYEAHVIAYHAEYKPVGQRQTHLLQQLTDLHWSFHQLAVEQSNTLALMAALNAYARQHQMDPMETLDRLAKATRTLNTLGIYEARKRRAAKTIQEEFHAQQKADSDRLAADLHKAAALYKTYEAQGKSFDPAEFGFVCSLENLLDFLTAPPTAAAPMPTRGRPEAIC